MSSFNYNNSVQLDMDVLAEFASKSEDINNAVKADILTQPTTIIGKINRLIVSTFGKNKNNYSTQDIENNV